MEPASLDRLRERWSAALAPFGAVPAAVEAAFADVADRYRQPSRHYHTLDHVAAVLDVLDELGGRSAPLALASWYHDAVYDTRAADNEELSAEFAREALPPLGVATAVIEEVARLILLTKTHQTAGDDVSGLQLVDADLAILGASAPVYDRYAAAIRREYAWVPEAAYRAGRRRVLDGFLARQRLFHFLQAAESPARANLQRESAALGRN